MHTWILEVCVGGGVVELIVLLCVAVLVPIAVQSFSGVVVFVHLFFII